MLLPSFIVAQISDLPKKPKPGKCYFRCSPQDFNYSVPVNKNKLWTEIECSEVSTRTKNNDKAKDLSFYEYQNLLKDTGFDVEISGIVDLKTVNAHNKYLKILKKNPKRRAKILSNLKEKKLSKK